uniref:TRIM8/14/16/25/29/45/65 coiled-coil region domain-containing protein n=1 Tax=Anguilla anguilla TaxID=7936 RepID=A0A0E9Y1Y2_ANGAN
MRRRDAELEQFSHTEDHIQFLQSVSLSVPFLDLETCPASLSVHTSLLRL